MEPWTPDPEATVATEPSWRVHGNPAPDRQGPSGPASGRSGTAGRTATAPTSPAHPRPPAVAPTKPMSRTTVPGQPASRTAAPTRSLSPAGPSQGRNPSRGGRPGDGRSSPAAGRPPRVDARPVTTRPPAAVRKRRPGGFVRFLQLLLSMAVLIVAPLAALVFAFSFSTGESLQEAANALVVELRHLLGYG
jgi:molecular chaperone DnaK